MKILVTAAALIFLLCGVLFYAEVGSWEAVQRNPVDDSPAGVAAPSFNIKVRGSLLHLQGDTVSIDHEQHLLQTAARYFSGREIDSIFQTVGATPEHWSITTVALLQTLTALRSGQAILTDRTLSVRGIGTHDWQRQLQALLPVLPRSVDTDIDVLVPGVSPDHRETCARAFAARKHGAITFQESGTSFRSSAYAVLDRIVALADACRDSTLLITGHTDSSGDETWNLHLSIERAEAVADYLVEKGITRNRLVVAGAGSAMPVADNSTRYGRSLNRRIEIEMR